MKNEVIYINSNTLGKPDDKLGKILMGNCLRLLGDREVLPDYIILINGGVLLAEKGADTVPYLKKLEDSGVKIISCVTCVEYFDLMDKIAVGETDGMVRILDILMNHPVVTI